MGSLNRFVAGEDELWLFVGHIILDCIALLECGVLLILSETVEVTVIGGTRFSSCADLVFLCVGRESLFGKAGLDEC